MSCCGSAGSRSRGPALLLGQAVAQVPGAVLLAPLLPHSLAAPAVCPSVAAVSEEVVTPLSRREWATGGREASPQLVLTPLFGVSHDLCPVLLTVEMVPGAAAAESASRLSAPASVVPGGPCRLEPGLLAPGPCRCREARQSG